ncbi:MAG TPA: hypothetical protein VES38_04810 [Methylotenera sp.]|nr:hypothetical protein [Methylotenera sp.]
MYKLLLLCAICTITLTACEKQKQASAEVGAIPKQIIDKATNDIHNAEVLATEKLKAAENAGTPEGVEQ